MNASSHWWRRQEQATARSVPFAELLRRIGGVCVRVLVFLCSFACCFCAMYESVGWMSHVPAGGQSFYTCIKNGAGLHALLWGAWLVLSRAISRSCPDHHVNRPACVHDHLRILVTPFYSVEIRAFEVAAQHQRHRQATRTRLVG